MGLSREEKQKEFFQKALTYATSRGGKCLSNEYITAKTKMRWKCADSTHDEWESTYDTVVQRGTWCNQCAIQKNANKSRDSNGLQKAKIHANSKNGECLSTEYINARTKLLWKCENSNHEPWKADLDHVINRGRWCRQCGYDKGIIENGYNIAHEYAKSRGGICFVQSNEVIKGHSILKWKCHDDTHPAWETTYRNAIETNTWCSWCAGKLPSDIYLKKAKEYAKSKGGVCLSEKYVDQQKTPLKWHCGCEEHEPFEMTYNNVVSKSSWCAKCKGYLTPEEYLQKAKQYAISKYGQCLSTEYKTTIDKLIWNCKNHGVFESDFANIVLNNRWCPICFKETRDNKSLNRAKDYAIKRGGECLTIKYNGNAEKLEWKCSNKKHSSWLAPISICASNVWCPKCGETYYKEKSIRLILESLLGFSLPKSRPAWNINSRTGYSLELDGYNKSHKFAFEFQGRHHYMDGIFKRQNLEDIQFKDKVKKENCKNYGIYLLVIDEIKNVKTNEQLFTYLLKVLNENNLKVLNYNKEDILKNLAILTATSEKNEYLAKAKEYAKLQNGLCLSDYYENIDTPLKWKCSKHEHDPWFATYYSVLKMNTWCPDCGNRPAKHTMLRKAHEYAQFHNGFCLSKEYINGSSLLEWKCHNKKHPSWKKSYVSIKKNNGWCLHCKK